VSTEGRVVPNGGVLAAIMSAEGRVLRYGWDKIIIILLNFIFSN